MKNVKVVFAGDSSVGKTCIIGRIKDHEFHENGDATVGAANCEVKVNTGTEDVTLTIWDTAGQEKYRSLTPIYFNGAALAILVFDITNKSTLSELDFFVQAINNKSPDYVKFVLVGNKADLQERREVTQEQAENYANDIDASFYIEISAKTCAGVDELFQRACSIPDLHFDNAIDAGVLSTENSKHFEKRKKCQC